ncbi:hypothetical protein ACUH9H_08390 [Dermabacteraceae bacterium P13128]
MEFIGRAAFTRRRGNLWSAALLLPCITASNYLNLPGGAATGLLLLSLLVAIPAAGGEFVLLMQEEAGNGTQVDTRDTGGRARHWLLSMRRIAALCTHSLLLFIACLGFALTQATPTLLILVIALGVSGLGIVEEIRFARSRSDEGIAF